MPGSQDSKRCSVHGSAAVPAYEMFHHILMLVAYTRQFVVYGNCEAVIDTISSEDLL